MINSPIIAFPSYIPIVLHSVGSYLSLVRHRSGFLLVISGTLAGAQGARRVLRASLEVFEVTALLVFVHLKEMNCRLEVFLSVFT